MDQEENCLVWMRRRQMLMMSSIMNTCEERAFMEDARGQLRGGGCMWPPRSYSCSFCRREFRSAQALGGHMNVHRRDRARLKQSLSPYNVPSNSTPKVFALGCDLDPTSFGSLSSSRVSAFSTQESSPSDQEHKKGCPNSNPEEAKSTTNPRGQIPPTFYIGIHEATSTMDADRKAMNRIDMEGLESSTTTCKRFKTCASGSTLSFLVPNDRCSLQLGHNYSLSSMEEIDLELRLGDPPRVKWQ